MRSQRKNQLYRSRNGLVFGVCQGFSDWRELPVGMVRVIVFFSIFVTGFFPGILIYLLLALFLPIEPRKTGYDYEDERQNDGAQGYHDRKADKEQDWDQRFYGRKK